MFCLIAVDGNTELSTDLRVPNALSKRIHLTSLPETRDTLSNFCDGERRARGGATQRGMHMRLVRVATANFIFHLSYQLL
jgi:hypothetical protein